MWDERYSDPEFVYGRAPNAFLARQAHRIPEGPVLCLAEGEGRNAVWLAQDGRDVTAVDASPVGIAKGRRLARDRGVSVEWICADLATYTIEPGHWAGIVSIFAHLPPALRRRVHEAVVSGLRPRGVLVLEAYTPRQLGYGTGGPPVREMLMDLAMLQNELAGLDFEIARECERDVLEGKYHTGLGHVVQIVARQPD